MERELRIRSSLFEYSELIHCLCDKCHQKSSTAIIVKISIYYVTFVLCILQNLHIYFVFGVKMINTLEARTSCIPVALFLVKEDA